MTLIRARYVRQACHSSALKIKIRDPQSKLDSLTCEFLSWRDPFLIYKLETIQGYTHVHHTHTSHIQHTHTPHTHMNHTQIYTHYTHIYTHYTHAHTSTHTDTQEKRRKTESLTYRRVTSSSNDLISTYH